MVIKKGIAVLMASLMIVEGSSGLAQAATSNYIAYSLPRLNGNKYTSLHDKTTNDDYVENEVTAVTDTTYVNCWAVTSGNKKISNKYKQGVGTGKKKLNFTSDYNLDRKDEAGLGMENYETSYSFAWVSGKVDFR